MGKNAIIDSDIAHFHEINHTTLLMLKKINGKDSIETIVPIVASMTIHEFSHYIFYRLLDKEKRFPFLGYVLGKAQIVRTSLPARQDMIVTIMGPLVPDLLGGLLILTGIYLGDNAYHIWLAGIIFSSHLLFLIPPSQDGKKALHILMKGILKKNYIERSRNR